MDTLGKSRTLASEQTQRSLCYYFNRPLAALTRLAMPNVQIIKEKDAVLIPIKDWEKLQREVVRLRKKVNKAKFMDDLRSAIISCETVIRSGKTPKGKDAREFIKELENEI